MVMPGAEAYGSAVGGSDGLEAISGEVNGTVYDVIVSVGKQEMQPYAWCWMGIEGTWRFVPRVRHCLSGTVA